jgi:hypothetical protein
MANPDALISDVGGVPKFYANGDLSSVGTRWTRWKCGFELFAVGKGVTILDQRKALLLHCATLHCDSTTGIGIMCPSGATCLPRLLLFR